MENHSQLLRDARNFAYILSETALAPYAYGQAAETFTNLADIVEAQDKSEATVLNEEMMIVIDAQDKSIIELVAACKACAKAISAASNFIAPLAWPKLSAARHLALVAIENYEKANEPPEEQPTLMALPVDWDRWHELLDIKKRRGLTTSEGEEFDKFFRTARELDTKEGKAADASLDKLVEEHERVLASLRRLTAAVDADAELQPRPIEVEMRSTAAFATHWRWECNLHGAWLAVIGADDERIQLTREQSQKTGNAWLAAVSKKLGVPLRANWKDNPKGSEE